MRTTSITLEAESRPCSDSAIFSMSSNLLFNTLQKQDPQGHVMINQIGKQRNKNKTQITEKNQTSRRWIVPPYPVAWQNLL